METSRFMRLFDNYNHIASNNPRGTTGRKSALYLFHSRTRYHVERIRQTYDRCLAAVAANANHVSTGLSRHYFFHFILGYGLRTTETIQFNSSENGSTDADAKDASMPSSTAYRVTWHDNER